MEKGTARTILLMLASGVVGGVAALAGALFLVMYMATGGTFPRMTFTRGPVAERVAAAPRVSEDESFLGTTGMHSDRFTAQNDRILEPGPGRITGLVTSNRTPVKGVRLRLALNGSVKSEWAVSGDDGRYTVRVPYDRYRVDGYDLDSEVARRVLKGKTDAPPMRFQTEMSLVEEGRPGAGIDLHYVDPVRITAPEGVVPASAPVVLGWAPYPNAEAYKLQLIDFADPGDLTSHAYVFNWKERPVVKGTSVDLAALGAKLQKGHHYSVQIEALDANGRAIATNGARFGRVTFSLSE